MLYYFKKSENAAEMQKKKKEKKNFVQYREKVLWLSKHVRSFMLEISYWTMLHDMVDNLIVMKSRY